MMLAIKYELSAFRDDEECRCVWKCVLMGSEGKRGKKEKKNDERMKYHTEVVRVEILFAESENIQFNILLIYIYIHIFDVIVDCIERDDFKNEIENLLLIKKI